MSENKPRRRAQAARAAKKSASRKSGLSRVMLVAMMMVMVAVVSIGGTLAWLQDETTPIVNTFTQSNIGVTLTESPNLDLQMIPGHTITKDPKAGVNTDSEDSYLFVELTKSENFDTFMTYEIADGWTAVPETENVYYRTVLSSATDREFAVLKGNAVQVKRDVTKTQLNALTTDTLPTLTVKAYAVQMKKDNTNDFTADEAWAIAKPANSGEGGDSGN